MLQDCWPSTRCLCTALVTISHCNKQQAQTKTHSFLASRKAVQPLSFALSRGETLQSLLDPNPALPGPLVLSQPLLVPPPSVSDPSRPGAAGSDPSPGAERFGRGRVLSQLLGWGLQRSEHRQDLSSQSTQPALMPNSHLSAPSDTSTFA